MTPAVSVIIPSFNAELWLRDAVASVQAQDFANWEIVIVDDASTELLSRELAKSLASEKIKFIQHEANRGVAVARNTAIKAALAPIIVPLDPDDELPLGALKAEVSAFAEGFDFVYGPQEQVDWLSGASTIVDPGRGARAKDGLGQPWHGCMPFRKALWQRLGGYDEWRGFAGLDDWHFWLRAEASGAKGGYCPETLYRYRMRPGSISSECRPEWFDASLRTFKDLPRGYLPGSLQREILVTRARQAATWYRKRGKPLAAAKCALKGIARVPQSGACWKTLCGCLCEFAIPPLRKRYTKLWHEEEERREELARRLRMKAFKAAK